MSKRIPNVTVYTAPYGLQGPQGIQGPLGPTGPVTSVNGQTGPITNLAVTNSAQNFSGVQNFLSGISTAGLTLISPSTTTFINAEGINTNNAFSVVAPVSLSLGSQDAAIGDTAAIFIESNNNRIRAADYRGGTFNINFNINRVSNTTSALFVNHSTGKTIRLGYNIPSIGTANSVDLDVSSVGNLVITPSGGTAQVNGNIQANNIVYSVNGQTGNVTITGSSGSNIPALYSLNFGQIGVTVSNTLEFLIQASPIDMGSVTIPNSVYFDGGLGFTSASGL
jgi:hypothetical protein